MTPAPDPIPLEGTREQCEALVRFVASAKANLHLLAIPGTDCYDAVMEQDELAGYWLQHLKARGIDA